MTREEALEQEPCEDWYDVPSDEMTLGQARRAVKDLRKKLSEQIEQEPKTGRWIFDEILDKHYYCSECKSMGVNYWDYCPYCGAKMDEKEQENE